MQIQSIPNCRQIAYLHMKHLYIVKKKGKKLLDMGGGKSGGGIERFKRNFISDDGVWKYYVLKKIHNPDIYNRFVARKKEIKNDKFFPLYRG